MSLFPPLFQRSIPLKFLILSGFSALQAHSPYALYLSAEHLRLQNQDLAAKTHFLALASQVQLPQPTLKSLSEQFARDLDWPSSLQILHFQKQLSPQNLSSLECLELELEPLYQIRSKWDLSSWKSRVTQTAGLYPDDLGLQTLLLQITPTPHDFLTSSKNSSLSSKDTNPEALGKYFRTLQDRFPIGDPELRAKNLPILESNLERLDRLGKLTPNSPWFYFTIDFRVMTAQLEKAESQLNALIQQFPEDLGLLKRLYRLQLTQNLSQEAQATYEKLDSLHGLDFDWRLSRAKHLLQNRNLPGALEAYLQLLRHHPCDYPLYLETQAAFLKVGEEVEAWRNFTLRTLKLFPNKAQSHYFAGLASFYTEDFQLAAKHLSNCERLAETAIPELLDLKFRHALGTSLMQIEDWENALPQFREGLKQTHSEHMELMADCFHGIAQSLLRMNLYLPESESFSHKAIQAQPSRIEFYQTLMECQLKQNSVSEAMQTQLQAQILDGKAVNENAEWQILIAQAQTAQNESAKARATLLHALQLPHLPQKLKSKIQSELQLLPP